MSTRRPLLRPLLAGALVALAAAGARAQDTTDAPAPAPPPVTAPPPAEPPPQDQPAGQPAPETEAAQPAPAQQALPRPPAERPAATEPRRPPPQQPAQVRPPAPRAATPRTTPVQPPAPTTAPAGRPVQPESPPRATPPARAAPRRAPTRVRPHESALAAIARIRRAAADTVRLAPRGPYPPYPAERAGLVWTPPAAPAEALDELLTLRRAGVRSVRVPVIEDTLLLHAADLLGVALWQDLPFSNLAAPHLVNALPQAEQTLRRALRRAARFRSARHFGLATYSDTSDPRARPYFQRLTEIAHAEGPEGVRTYYLTRFPRMDRCARTVDLVLLDARDADPSDVITRWRARHPEPAGIGSFGAAVRPGAQGGWRTPGTYEAQARALERGLGAALALDVPALFIYRWRDDTPAGPAPLLGADVRGAAHGLMGRDGTPRPAFDVVRGFFTGTQRVFAFDAGPPPAGQHAASPLVLAGWGLVLLLGLLYAGTSRFPNLAGRYFGRHDLYREAVQRGFDLEPGVNALLGAGVALSAGVVGTSALRGLARTDALAAATTSLGPEGQAVVAALLGRPAVLTLLIAGAYAVWLMVHMVWLHVLAGRRRRLRPAQALTLAVWSRWGVVALLGAAMLLAAAPASSATAGVPLLLGAWAVVEFAALARETADLAAVARVSPARARGIGFGLPALLMGLSIAAAALATRAELAFLWHLATRG